MINNRRGLLNKRLPPSFGIGGLVLALVTITWLSGNALLFGTKAANGNVPRNVQITNVSDSSFTVSYSTDEFAIGTINYGANENLGKVGLDDRDQQLGSPVSHRLHHITIKQLIPSTKYYFTIVSGDRTFSNDTVPYTVTTAPPTATQPTTQAPAAGSVSLEDGNLPAEGIVYLSSKDSQLLSALLKPDGGYLVPLNTIRQKNLASILSFTPDSILEMTVTNAVVQSKLSILASQTNPVPRIILSKDYTFTANDAEIDDAVSVTATESADFPITKDTTQVTKPEIISPKNDETFQDPKPLFSGKALANESLAIGILSDQNNEIKTTSQADTNGNWEYRPTEPLAPGTYTITIASVDTTGEIVTVTNTFVVNASGSQFTEPSISPSPSFDITPSASPSPTPTTALTPTLSPTEVLTPTASPTPVMNASPSAAITQPPLPEAGSESIFLVMIGTGLSIGVGLLLFFLSRGSITV